jgi:hypothetical protein
MNENNEQSVRQYLRQGLGCEVGTQPQDKREGTLFVPAGDGFGRLQLGDDIASGEAADLLERLHQDGIAELLRKGERVRVTRAATEILPSG